MYGKRKPDWYTQIREEIVEQDKICRKNNDYDFQANIKSDPYSYRDFETFKRDHPGKNVVDPTTNVTTYEACKQRPTLGKFVDGKVVRETDRLKRYYKGKFWSRAECADAGGVWDPNAINRDNKYDTGVCWTSKAENKCANLNDPSLLVPDLAAKVKNKTAAYKKALAKCEYYNKVDDVDAKGKKKKLNMTKQAWNMFTQNSCSYNENLNECVSTAAHEEYERIAKKARADLEGDDSVPSIHPPKGIPVDITKAESTIQKYLDEFYKGPGAPVTDQLIGVGNRCVRQVKDDKGGIMWMTKHIYRIDDFRTLRELLTPIQRDCVMVAIGRDNLAVLEDLLKEYQDELAIDPKKRIMLFKMKALDAFWDNVGDLYLGVDDLESYDNFYERNEPEQKWWEKKQNSLDSSGFLPSLSQSIVNMLMKSNFVNHSSNRGLLAWHSTGSGKTCTAAGIMESFWDSDRQIVFASSGDAIRSNPDYKFHECAMRLYPRFQQEPFNGQMDIIGRKFKERGIIFITFAELANRINKMEKLKNLLRAFFTTSMYRGDYINDPTRIEVPPPPVVKKARVESAKKSKELSPKKPIPAPKKPSPAPVPKVRKLSPKKIAPQPVKPKKKTASRSPSSISSSSSDDTTPIKQRKLAPRKPSPVVTRKIKASDLESPIKTKKLAPKKRSPSPPARGRKKAASDSDDSDYVSSIKTRKLAPKKRSPSPPARGRKKAAADSDDSDYVSSIKTRKLVPTKRSPSPPTRGRKKAASNSDDSDYVSSIKTRKLAPKKMSPVKKPVRSRSASPVPKSKVAKKAPKSRSSSPVPRSKVVKKVATRSRSASPAPRKKKVAPRSRSASPVPRSKVVKKVATRSRSTSPVPRSKVVKKVATRSRSTSPAPRTKVAKKAPISRSASPVPRKKKVAPRSRSSSPAPRNKVVVKKATRSRSASPAPRKKKVATRSRSTSPAPRTKVAKKAPRSRSASPVPRKKKVAPRSRSSSPAPRNKVVVKKATRSRSASPAPRKKKAAPRSRSSSRSSSPESVKTRKLKQKTEKLVKATKKGNKDSRKIEKAAIDFLRTVFKESVSPIKSSRKSKTVSKASSIKSTASTKSKASTVSSKKKNVPIVVNAQPINNKKNNKNRNKNKGNGNGNGNVNAYVQNKGNGNVRHVPGPRPVAKGGARKTSADDITPFDYFLKRFAMWYRIRDIKLVKDAMSTLNIHSPSDVVDLDHCALIIDEVHNLFRPLDTQRVQHQFVESQIVDPNARPSLKMVILTATPGDNVTDVMKLLNAIRDPTHIPIEAPTSEPSDVIRFKKQIRGLISYFDMSSDQTKFPTVTDHGIIKYPMNTKQFIAYADQYKKAKEEYKDYDGLAQENKLSKYWSGPRKYSNMMYTFEKGMAVSEFSSKLPALLDKLKSFPDHKQYVYSAFHTAQGSGQGIQEIARQLDAMGYSKLTPQMAKEANKLGRTIPIKKRYILAIQSDLGGTTPEEAGKTLGELLKIYNSDANKNGELAHIFLASQSFNEGLDLKSVRHIHIFEPLVTMASDLQTIGRARRFCSHAQLDKSDWKVEIHRYLSDLPTMGAVLDGNIEAQIRGLEGSIKTHEDALKAAPPVGKPAKDVLTKKIADAKKQLKPLKKQLKYNSDLKNVKNVDQVIYDESRERFKQLFDVYNAMKGAAVDCMLLKDFHANPDIVCLDE